MVKKNSLLIKLIIISLSVCPAIALGEGNRNLFLIGVMSISPIIILRFFEFDKLDFLLLLFLITIAIFPTLFHPDTMRWSTVLYSVMFGLTFIAYKQLLRQKHFSVLNYIKILKLIIYAYFIVLLIQQFCVLTGLPVFNVSNYDVQEPWKLNALASEPSHSGRILPLLMYSYITIYEKLLNRSYDFKKDVKADKWVWIAFVWSVTTMGSGTAILFLFVFLTKFIRLKKLIKTISISIMLILMIGLVENKSVQRTKEVILATLTLNEDVILNADHSAAMRILPVMVAFEKAGFNSLNDWVGNGVDFTTNFLSDEIPGLAEGTSGGGMFQIWLEYGFISFALFVMFSLFNSYRKRDYVSFLFWFLLVFAYGVNNQIVWLCIVLLYTNQYFEKKQILIIGQTYLKK